MWLQGDKTVQNEKNQKVKLCPVDHDGILGANSLSCLSGVFVCCETCVTLYIKILGLVFYKVSAQQIFESNWIGIHIKCVHRRNCNSGLNQLGFKTKATKEDHSRQAVIKWNYIGSL